MLKELKNRYPDILIEENADMSKFCSFKAGGSARYMVSPKTVDELKETLKFLSEKNMPHLILGNGTNTLFRDGVYEGVVIKLDEEAFGKAAVTVLEDNAVEISAGAAMLLSSLAKLSFSYDAEGMEGVSGIPGSVGGAVFMNAGAYDCETKNFIKSVHAVAPDGSEEKDFENEEMVFDYRHSALMENGYIVTSVVINLKKGDREEIKSKYDKCTKSRCEKQPLTYPSAGSTFKRPEGHFAGKLIQDAGLKGLSVGGAEVSTLHAGFIINKGNATATDILKLITLVQNTVYDKFGVKLEPEIRII